VTRVLGLDLSLVATGVADESGTRVIKAPKKEVFGAARLSFIHDELFEEMRFVRGDRNYDKMPDVAIIESAGYFKGDAQYVLELHGVVKLALYRLGIPFVLVAPQLVKKFATGSGVADKDHMLAAAIRKFGFEGTSNNEADAFLMRQMGLAHYDMVFFEGEATWPGYQREALARIEWPTLEHVNA
jgi:Holliday junction resolvasome RuvABC endonuclease subunit